MWTLKFPTWISFHLIGRRGIRWELRISFHFIGGICGIEDKLSIRDIIIEDKFLLMEYIYDRIEYIILKFKYILK